jgi:uncharacterized protein involved in response to NO
MLFGFLAAVVAGFLTTAVPNWTGRMPVIGGPLGALFGLWVAGRAAMLMAPDLGAAAAGVDSLFLLVFASVVWREVLAGRNWRNLPVCALVTLFAAGNVVFHLDAELGLRLGLAAISVLLALIGGRITPSFTTNWLRARGASALPKPFGAFDRLAMGLTALAAAGWAAAPTQPASGVLLLLAGFANVARLSRWRGVAAAEPLLFVLHLGFAWLAVAQVLLGASLLAPDVIPRTAGIHALTAGAVGVMTLAVMTRASRGHTGRPLSADWATMAIYLAANLSAAVRVAAPFAESMRPMLLAVSALLWVAAFGGFALAYGRMLTQPRPLAA